MAGCQRNMAESGYRRNNQPSAQWRKLTDCKKPRLRYAAKAISPENGTMRWASCDVERLTFLLGTPPALNRFRYSLPVADRLTPTRRTIAPVRLSLLLLNPLGQAGYGLT